MKNRIIFIVSGYYLNGGTTFLCRLIKSLSESGYECGILFLQNKGNDKLLEEIEKYCEVRFLIKSKFISELYRVLIYCRINKKMYKWVNSYQHVHVMGLFSLAFYLCLKIKQRPLTVGVYQQNEYFNSGGRVYYFQQVIKEKLISLKGGNWVFFNEVNRSFFCDELKIKDIENAKVLPIGIVTREKRSIDQVVEKKIVSINNLVPFKTYVELVIRSVAKMKKSGIIVHYDIYGAGSEKKRLEKLSEELKIQNQIFFKGSIEYSHFEQILSKAKVFVGSGTALLESAMLGVPSVIGIENNINNETYGCLKVVVGFSYNEDEIGLKKEDITELLIRICSLDVKDEEYRSISNAERNKAKEFSIDKTAEGFKDLVDAELISENLCIGWLDRFLSVFSILGAFLWHVLKIDKSVRERKAYSK